MSGARILIVEDEKVLSRSLKMDLEDEGYQVSIADSGEEAIGQLADFRPSVVLLDLRLPGMDGIQVLERIRAWNENIAVIIMTAYGDTRTTVDAIKRGAYNFVNKPFDLDELKALVRKAFDSQNLKREFEYLKYQQRRFYRFCDLVGNSPQMKEIYEQIDLLAQTENITVLIRGESGTGKELVAGAVHFKSRRSKAPFVEINCASLPESLLESELFGYEKGAFTDAKQQKKGLFELGDGGTIFLDEIGEMPFSVQAKLLRFLEKKQFKRLGSGKDLKVDARIIAATNKDLEKAIVERRFREDLYYRLNVVSLYLPPLRERKEDILLLANYFLNEFCRDMGKAPMVLSAEVERIFESYPWRGNVRELRNVIERTVIFAKGKTIEKDLLPPELFDGPKDKPAGFIDAQEESNRLPLDEILAKAEKKIIDDALGKTGGNKSRAAELLGISRFSLNRRMERLRKAKKSRTRQVP